MYNVLGTLGTNRVKLRHQFGWWVSKCSCNPPYVGNRAPQDAHPCTFMTSVIMRVRRECYVIYTLAQVLLLAANTNQASSSVDVRGHYGIQTAPKV